MVLLLGASINGQVITDKECLPVVEWSTKQVTEGVMLKTARTRLFDSFQAIYVIDIDTTAGEFEFGVAVPETRLFTSAIASKEEVLAAVNGTFFNMQEGYNVHFVKVNDSVLAVTDDKEYGIRATGLFSADGEAVDISAWGPEREDHRAVTAEDAIVSGPLLMDDGREIPLDSINFNTLRHPRTMIGATGDGHILFIVVDGRQPEYGEGMSLFELRALARSLGCSDILNLDGGGSTAMYLRGEGSTGVVNRPSGKVERAVPSILFVKEKDN
jgi:exopolysaccharide biosynthesis protein